MVAAKKIAHDYLECGLQCGSLLLTHDPQYKNFVDLLMLLADKQDREAADAAKLYLMLADALPRKADDLKASDNENAGVYVLNILAAGEYMLLILILYSVRL